MNQAPRTSMFAAWTMLILAGIGTGLAIEEQRKDAERPIELEYIKPGFTACATQGILELYQQSTTRDRADMYLDDMCMSTDTLGGYRFVVLNEGTATIYKIRLELEDDQFADLFVPVESITEKGPL